MGNTLGLGLFYGRGNFRLNNRDMPNIDFELRTKQVYVSILTWIMIILSISAVAVSLVPGAGTGGPVVTFSAMPRIIWLIPTIAVCAFTLVAVMFDSTGNVGSTSSWTIVAMWMHVFAIAFNLILLISVAVEINQGTSTFYLQNGGAWAWVFVIGSAIFVLWSLWIIWRLYVYYADLLEGASLGWRVGIVEMSDVERGTTATQPQYEQVPQASAPSMTEQEAAKRNINTVASNMNTSQLGKIGFNIAVPVFSVTDTAIKKNE